MTNEPKAQKSRSGGTILVECLRSLGAEKIYGVPGESYLDVLNALHDTKGQLDFILCRNEGGAAFMAEAFGKLTGKPGLCFVTRGPGATNASIGVHTAMQGSTPMLLFVGQVGTDQQEREAFQEVNYRAYFGSIAKWVTEINEVDRIPELIARAWTTALSGRPGPVVIALPENMLTAMSMVEPCGPVRISEPDISVETLGEIHQALSKAKRPLIITGGNSWTKKGKQDLRDFSEKNKIPALAAFRFQDLFDNQSPSYCGDAGVGMAPNVRKLISDSDLILAINIRFGEMTTDAYSLFEIPHPRQKIVHSHISDRELGKIYIADIPVHAGPNATASALASLNFSSNWENWWGDARAGYEAGFEAPAQPGDVDMVEITRYLRGILPADSIITNGAGNFATWANKFIKFTDEMRLLAPQSGAMGYGVPAAIAAKTVMPERMVVCFAGDGDFQMNCQELGTAMQAGAQPIILILNNGSYGTIRMHQERTYPTRVSGTELLNPDFVMLAKSYGFHAEKVLKTADFATAFERAKASKTGAVVELMIATEALTPRQTLSQMRATALANQRRSL